MIKRRIIERETLFFRNKTQENSFLFLCESLTYLNFGKAYQSCFGGQISKFWKYFAIIYEGFLIQNNAPENIEFIVCFKQL